MLQSFGREWENGRLMPRLRLSFPNAPHDDVFARMSCQKMLELQGHLKQLHEWLEEAQRAGSAAPLGRAFGDAFPER
jgi:hypothetical protein